MNFLPILNLVLQIGGLVGGIVGSISMFRHGYKIEVARIANDTIQTLQNNIEALKGQIETLKGQIETLAEKQTALDMENVHLRQIIETIKAALSKRGIFITIDGEMITIQEKDGTTSTLRKRPTSTKPKPAAEER